MPGVSNTCAATAPVAEFLLLTPAVLPLLQVPLVGSPKSQRYSISWKGRVVNGLVVPVASKNTANGATPDVRDGISEIEMTALTACVVALAATDWADSFPAPSRAETV